MADINLKTLTPDTSLPTTGFLFGADSQASTNPSVYSTQTVATTLLGSTSLTGDTLTADAPVLNLAQTWNNGAVTFTGIKYNATSTASAAASLLMDLQVGAVSKFKVDKSGNLTFGDFNSSYINTNGTRIAVFNPLYLGTNSSIGFATQYNPDNGGPDLFLTRKGTGNLRLGAADAASPVAQTLSVQSVVAGTSNKAGENFTITGSQGTGTGTGGSIIFQVAPAGGSGSAQNTLQTALTIGSDKIATFASTVRTSASFVNSTGGTSGGGGSGVSFIDPANGFIIQRESTFTGNIMLSPTQFDTIFVEFGRNPWSAAPGPGNISAPQTTGTNATGVNFNISGGVGTGTGVGGAIVFQIATTGSSGSAINSRAEALRITSAGLLTFAGVTSSFPALKRSTTTLQARLADDSAFTNIQGKLTTDNAYTAGVVTLTGFVTIYDSTGTAYKVPVGT